MAFGIDDMLSAAAAGLELTNTLVDTVKAYRKKGVQLDIERLIEEVRITALERLDDADRALNQFEKTLIEKGADLDKTLEALINATPWWRPFEGYRLKHIRQSFTALADATYCAVDDIASLVRCRDQTKEMGHAIVDSAKAKHHLHSQLLDAPSVKAAISILREELVRQKKDLY